MIIGLGALTVGMVLGVGAERWRAGNSVRSDVVCVASRQELARFEETLTHQPRMSTVRTFMETVEQAQANIARNCGWLPPSATLAPPKPTEAPKPAAPPKP